MKVHIGSRDPTELLAVRSVFGHYFKDAEFHQLGISSAVDSQPSSLREAVIGARVRATRAGGNFGVGLENGLVPHAEGHADLCVCVLAYSIKQSTKLYEGHSEPFPIPGEIAVLALQPSSELRTAIYRMGRIPASFKPEYGAIGILSEGKITRLGQMKQAVERALTEFFDDVKGSTSTL